MKRILFTACIVAALSTTVLAQSYTPTYSTQLLLRNANKFKLTILPDPAMGADYTLRMPPGLGANGDVLVTDGSGNLSWLTPGGGGLTHWTEAVNTAAPNATIPVVSWTVTNASANVDAAILPKGTGALLAAVPDNAATGGNKRGQYAVDLQMSRNAPTNVADGDYAVIGGGGGNTASGQYSTVGGGFDNDASFNSATVGGGSLNTASGQYSTIAGGSNSIASGNYSSVGGGDDNEASGPYSTIGGGYNNLTSQAYAAIGGGNANTASGNNSTVGGGISNIAAGLQSTVGGGNVNEARGANSVISGGYLNEITPTGYNSAIVGGYDNEISGEYSFIGGGHANTIAGNHSAIPGGQGLTLTAAANSSFGFHANDGTGADASPMTIAETKVAVFGNADLWLANNDNSPSNLVFFEAYGTPNAFPNTAHRINIASPAVIGADYTLTLPVDDGTANQVLTTDGAGVLSWTTPGGGGLTHWTEAVNTAAPNATRPVVSWAATNAATDVDAAILPKGLGALLADVPDNAVTGGNKRGTSAVDLQILRSANNQVASGNASVIAGGADNRASDILATVSGGQGNTASQPFSTVGGGSGNAASGTSSVVAGGAGNDATALYSFVGGGVNNTASANHAAVVGGEDNIANDVYTAVGGGFDNTASGIYAVVSGGRENTAAGEFSAITGGRGLTLSNAADRSFGFHSNNVGGTLPMTIAAPDVAVFGNADLWLANNDNTPSNLVFFEAYNTAGAFPNATANRINIAAPASITADYTLTLPVDDGTANQVLTTDGAGVLSWTTPGGGGGILNQTTVQSSANFNIDGSGTAATFKGNDGTVGAGLTVRGGNGSTSIGGALNLMAGTSSGAVGASGVNMNAADASGGNNSGGNVAISAGAGAGTGTGGQIFINGGGSAGSAAGGAVTISGGGGGASGVGGTTTLRGGAGGSGTANGGPVVVTGGVPGSAGGGGAATLSGGNAAGTGVGGAVTINAGTSAGTNQNGANVSISAGNATATNANGGNITLTPGNLAGTGTNGYVEVTGGKQMRFNEPSGSEYSSFQAGAQTTNIVYTLPTTLPTPNQVLAATAVSGSNVTLGWVPGSTQYFLWTGSSALTTFDQSNTEFCFVNGDANPNTTVGNFETVIPVACTITAIYVTINGDAGGGNSYTFDVVNSTASTNSNDVVISGASETTDSITGQSYTVNAGDRIYLRCIPNSNPTARFGSWTILATVP